MEDLSAPKGFELHDRASPLTDPWQPILKRTLEDRLQLGLYLREAHTNARGMAHGGFIAALADNAMGHSTGVCLAGEGRKIAGLVTVSLGMDYISAAALGQWILFDTDFVKTGGSICFARQMITADGEPIAKASATFKIVKPKG
jgi:acyl-coenzyme A thioesterase PaaI-like protein